MVQFRKRMKILPGVRLNFSKGGISTSVGVKGANLTLGKNGVHSNVGLPGTGLYSRKKISGEKGKSKSLETDNMNLNYSYKTVHYFHLGYFIAFSLLWVFPSVIFVASYFENAKPLPSILLFTLMLSLIHLYFNFLCRKKKRNKANINKIAYITSTVTDQIADYPNCKEYKDVDKIASNIMEIWQYIDSFKNDKNIYTETISNNVDIITDVIPESYNIGIGSVVAYKHKKLIEKIDTLTMQSAKNRHIEKFIVEAEEGLSLLNKEDKNYSGYVDDISDYVIQQAPPITTR